MPNLVVDFVPGVEIGLAKGFLSQDSFQGLTGLKGNLVLGQEIVSLVGWIIKDYLFDWIKVDGSYFWSLTTWDGIIVSAKLATAYFGFIVE